MKNIIGAVAAAQKLTGYGSLFAIIISGVLLLGRVDDPSKIGPHVAVIFMVGFYAVIVEFLLLPLRLNAERKMNEEMELGFLKLSGFTNRRIAYMLGISEQTVKNHFSHIYEKAWVAGRKEFREMFIQEGD